MSQRPSTKGLEYASASRTPTVITLIDDGSVVTLIFPPPPQWFQIGAILCNAVYLGFVLSMFAFAAREAWRFAILSGVPLSDTDGYFILLFALLILSVLIAEIVYMFLHHRRWGRMPNTLTCSNGELIWKRRSIWWGMKDRKFGAGQISSVEAKPVSDIFKRRGVWKLVFGLKRGGRFKLPIRTKDVELPSRASDAFRRVLMSGQEQTSK